MYKISPYTPLFFHPSNDETKKKSKYIQKFCSGDRILIEVIATDTDKDKAPRVELFDEISETISVLEMSKWEMNLTTALYFYELIAPKESFFNIRINGLICETFQVTRDERGTLLLQYSMNTNTRNNDGVFFIEGLQHFFDFRINGGFKDSEWQFGVDNEQYNTADNDLLDVYAIDNSQRTLTMGDARGCPIWFGEHLNRILCCSYFYINGVRYSRKDSSIPEINIINENTNSFVFKQVLQEVRNYNPSIEQRNEMLMRRTEAGDNRFTNDDKVRIV